MPLQSKLFSGDAALAACLVSDPAHLMTGATGAHVGKIQIALLTLDHALIDGSELFAGRYGTSTAAAVLAYKQKRNIINSTYQTSADNIVGKMTIAALDKEMLTYEQSQPASRVVHCQFGKILSPELIVEEAGFAASFDPMPSPRAAALKRKAAALEWVAAADQYLRGARRLFASARPEDRLKLGTMDEWRALVTHFKCHAHPEPLKYLDNLISTYYIIYFIIMGGEMHFADDLSNEKDFAYTPLGGFSLNLRITFCPRYLGVGPLFQTAVIVHEAAHFASFGIDHVASELPPWDGTPVDGVYAKSTTNYAQMSWTQASQNAYSYAQFALHAIKKRDYRLKPFSE